MKFLLLLALVFSTSAFTQEIECVQEITSPVCENAGDYINGIHDSKCTSIVQVLNKDGEYGEIEVTGESGQVLTTTGVTAIVTLGISDMIANYKDRSKSNEKAKTFLRLKLNKYKKLVKCEGSDEEK